MISVPNYTSIIHLSDSNFKRLVGVKRQTFDKMCTILQNAYDIKHSRRGRKSKLSVEDMLLLTLNYLRTYNTFFETGINFGVSESTAQRIELWVEETLILERSFSLPDKKVLTDESYNFEIMLFDVTEHQIERPKKSKKPTIQERKSITALKHK